MKCRIMQHFNWVFTVCKGTHLGVFGLQMVKYLDLCQDFGEECVTKN